MAASCRVVDPPGENGSVVADDSPSPSDAVRRGVRTVVAAGVIVASTIWDEALLSAPVVLSTARWGPWPAFVVFVGAYGAGGVLVTMLVVRAYRQRLGQRSSRLERWVEREAETRRSRWARKLLMDSGWLGFLLGSFALGPVVTTWMLVATGRVRDGVWRTAAGSSTVFAVAFVGQYCGLSRLVFGG